MSALGFQPRQPERTSAPRKLTRSLERPRRGRKATAMRVGKLEFPNDYSAHHFHVGCAISENPQNSGIFEFIRQKSDGHRMVAIGPLAASPVLGLTCGKPPSR